MVLSTLCKFEMSPPLGIGLPPFRGSVEAGVEGDGDGGGADRAAGVMAVVEKRLRQREAAASVSV